MVLVLMYDHEQKCVRVTSIGIQGAVNSRVNTSQGFGHVS